MTVVKPQEVRTVVEGGECIAKLGEKEYSPGSETRCFVAVPPGATWARLRTTAGSFPTPKVLP